MAEQQAHHNTLLMPILAGLAGAGLALLFAPRSGRETRDMMRHNAEETMDAAKAKLDQNVTQAKDQLRNAMQATGRQAKSKMDKIKKSRDESAETPMTSTWEQEV
jgi:gas vesicle protein